MSECSKRVGLLAITRLAIACLALAVPASAAAQTEPGADRVAAPVQRAAPLFLLPYEQALSTAATLVVQLQSARPSVALMVDYTQDTDPEYLLGLTGQYLAKATFHDAVVLADPTQPTGSIEVFAKASHLQTRQATMLKLPAEQDVDLGTVLLRVYSTRNADDLAAYKAALSGATT